MLEKEKGFSLVELLIAVGLIVILTGVALVSFRGTKGISRDAQRKTELEEIRSALELYRLDEGEYPANLATLQSAGYITVPTDPLTTQSYHYDYLTAATYRLCARLETETGTTDCSAGDCGSAGDCNYEVNQP